MERYKFKIAFIGAGSISFTRTLLSDILSVPEFSNIDVSFIDINEQYLEMVRAICQRDIEKNNLNIKIFATTDRIEGLRGAKYVINCTRIGGLEAYESDISVPLKYGVDQCVGDTLGAGGIMYGQRGINAVLDFCKDIKEVAAKDCLLLNYSNPNAMMTWACNHYGNVKTIGLCHGVQGGHKQIAGALGLSDKEVDIICAGINHQTWYISVKHNGEDMLDKVLDAYLKDEYLTKSEKVRINMMKHFGYYSTESNGHLSEYLPWFRKRPSDIMNWIDLESGWIHGETGGYLRICTEGRNWFLEDFPNWVKEEPKQYSLEGRSEEFGSFIIESLETGRMFRGHFNVVNKGCISNLADDAIVEVPCFVDANGISVPKVGDLPLACAAICNNSINVQRMAVKAAVYGDATLLKQAMMLDPLNGAVCNLDEIAQMTDEMLIAGEKWLPQYAQAIEKAKEYFAKGDVIATSDYKGAARLKVKSIEEMAKDPEKMKKLVNATDKK